MKILCFTGYYIPGYKGGGPIKTIKNLIDRTKQRGLQFYLVTGDRDLGDSERYSSIEYDSWNTVGNAEVYYTSPNFAGLRQIKDVLLNTDYDVLYLNSFFSFRFSLYPQLLARFSNKTVIVGPRGEFSEGALNIKRNKKRILIWIYKLMGLQRKSIFQASSYYEEKDISSVLGKDIDIKIAEDIGSSVVVNQVKESFEKKLRLIFVSRISPKKNLIQAIECLSEVSFPVLYDIYGPIEDREYWLKCVSAIRKLPIHIEVRYRGTLNPDEVLSTMVGYDMFFMPTFGENYGHVIAEALCAGLPVLISDATPWRNLRESNIGWDIPLDNNEGFVKVIENFSQLSADDYLDMRTGILNWAKDKFSQMDAIEDNVSLFKYAYEKGWVSK